MTPDLGDQPGTDPLEDLNALAREARNAVAEPSPAERAREWSKVAARMKLLARRRTLVRYSAAGLLTAAAAAGILVLRPMVRPQPAPPSTLAYEIRGGSVAEGGYLRESGSDGIELRFSDGTLATFEPGTRGRLRSLGVAGAHFAVEHGHARFQVTPRPHADWSVELGPFLVTVKGTVFSVAWDAVTERLELTLERGLVSVTGPVTSGVVLLKGGQRLAVDLPRKKSVITEFDQPGSSPVSASAERPPAVATQAAEPAPSLEPAPGRAPRASSRVERAVAHVEPGSRRDWPRAVADGNWDGILAEVDRAGVRQTLAQATSDELLALADAARYRRRNDLARDALLADRRRFAGSASALDASYLLGRLAESGAGGATEAIEWYDTYLAGAPAGPFASDALGRKMMAKNQLQLDAEAHALARDYLRRFPRGSYAGAARALLRSP